MKDLSYKLFFKALANRTRFEIVELLRTGAKTVGEISERLGYEQSRISHNLKCLEDCGFVTIQQNGKNRVYSLEPTTILPILALIDEHITRYHDHIEKCGIIQLRFHEIFEGDMKPVDEPIVPPIVEGGRQ